MGVKGVGGVISSVCAVLPFFSMTADYMYWQGQGKHGLSAKANRQGRRDHL